MTPLSRRLSLAFSCIGHAYIHLFIAFYFVIVLALEGDWGLPYGELMEFWMLGALLVGLGALPAGWLGDRWSAGGMLAVMFVGMGGSSVLCAFAAGPGAMAAGLAGIGLFAAIYHPVGIAWLVRNSDANRGKILGLNGIFGSVGVAAAALVTGALIDAAGWRAAFLVPGLVSIATGLALVLCLHRGWVRDGAGAPVGKAAGASRSDMRRVFLILLATMFLAAIIFHATQAALPKVFALRLTDIVGGRALGVGAAVALVYGLAGFMQVVGGHLADKYPLKPVYVGFFLVQVPFLFVAAGLAGAPLIAVAVFMVVFGVGGLPAENMLLARYAPREHHGLVFGAKFLLYFGAGPLALLLVSRGHAATGGFWWLFVAMAAMAGLCALAALLLPGQMPNLRLWPVLGRDRR